MPQVHATVGVALLVVAAIFTAIAAVMSRRSGSRPWLERLRQGVVVLLFVQAALGAFIYSQGHRAQEGLHVLYGVIALATLPAASAFSAEAPPRPRAGVLAVGGLLVTLLTWRLISTG